MRIPQFHSSSYDSARKDTMMQHLGLSQEDHFFTALFQYLCHEANYINFTTFLKLCLYSMCLSVIDLMVSII